MRNFFGVVLLLAGTIVFANVVQGETILQLVFIVPVFGILYPWDMKKI